MVAILVSSCIPLNAQPAAQPSVALEVAPELRNFWSDHGGSDTFGPPIQPPLSEGSLVRQFFLNVELVYNPDASPSRRITLSPLGWRLGLAEPPVSPPAEPGARYFPATGHTLYTGFAATYQQLGAESLAGAPIAEVKFKDGRVFQYFENLGLYRNETDAPSEVHLLALGIVARPDQRTEIPSQPSIVLPPTIIFRPFAGFLDRFGGERLFGPPLTEPYLAADGALEQIYERAVIFSAGTDPQQADLRPLGREIGPPDPSVPPVDDLDALYFPETGHNVRWSFALFYKTYQGRKILGLPLEEAHLQQGQLVQRFENGILEYHYDLPAHLAVQLAPLGRDFMAQHSDLSVSAATPARPEANLPTPTALSNLMTVSTWPLHTLLGSGEQQIIYIRAQSPEGNPAPGILPLIAIYGESSESYPRAAATDDLGMTSVSLKSTDFRPGEIVNYEVVIAGANGFGYAQGQFAILLGTPWP